MQCTTLIIATTISITINTINGLIRSLSKKIGKVKLIKYVEDIVTKDGLINSTKQTTIFLGRKQPTRNPSLGL